MKRYIPELLDPILKNMLVEWKLTDYEAAERIGFCARTIKERRESMGIPANLRQPRPVHESDRPLPKERPNPINTAQVWLGRRLEERESGYWLDGRPVNLPTIMRETNRILMAAGAEQFGPPQWRVK